MKTINFKLLKNNQLYVNKNNLNCILVNNKITFVIDDDKYTFENNILEKNTNKDKIQLDFNNNICKIYVNEYNDYLPIKLYVIENKKTDNITTIKYKIESEENVVNTIIIEYI